MKTKVQINKMFPLATSLGCEKTNEINLSRITAYVSSNFYSKTWLVISSELKINEIYY